MTLRRVWAALLLAVALSGVAATAVQAQEETQRPGGRGAVTGTVLGGETGEPIGSTMVEILFVADSVVAGQTLTNVQGQFLIGSLPEGEFYLRMTNVGYSTTTTQPFELAYGETRNLGELRLAFQAIAMEPIEVSSERSAVTFEADRTSYNLGVMGGTEGASVTESLQMIPELEIDIDGRVTLRGNTPAIYINGRSSPMTGEALATFLEQFPADYLEKIEVMENPSARYDAEGSGGIVNLVMKEGVELGLSGSVFANAGTRGQYGIGGRGTLQRGDLTVSGGGFARLSDTDNTSYDLRQNLLVDPAFLRRDSWSDRSGLSNNADLSVRYQTSERMEWSARGRVSGSGNDAAGLTTTTYLDDSETPFLVYDRASASDGRNLSFDMSTGFEYAWEPREHELEVELQYETGRQRSDQREEITSDVDVSDPDLLIPAELTLEEEREVNSALSLDVDYSRPLGESAELEIGFQSELEDSDNDRLIRYLEAEGAVGDATNRGIDQREFSNSIYATVRRQFGSMSAQLGLRAEQMEFEFDVPTGETFKRTYTNFFPSANLSYNFERGRQVRLSYSRRIGRPGASVLNPINTSTDPSIERVGNPDIEPQYTHSITMNASWSGDLGNIRLSPYYQKTTNDWTQITTVDDRGVSVRTYENLASQESYGASLTYSVRPRNGWGGSLSVSGRQTNRDASNLAARYSGNSLRWSSRANIDARITDAFSAQGNFSYSPPTDLPQGRSDAQYRADMGLRYRFLENRASIRLSLEDPFELRRSSSRLEDLSYIQIGRSQESTRSAQLSVSYALGGGGRWGGGGGGRR